VPWTVKEVLAGVLQNLVWVRLMLASWLIRYKVRGGGQAVCFKWLYSKTISIETTDDACAENV
jgi:hypothetical protein